LQNVPKNAVALIFQVGEKAAHGK